jgi:anti-anti-sigma factor
MEILTHASADLAELLVRGMLDSHWAEHLSRAIDQAVRGGCHRVLVNLSGVTYLSSAGIAALVKAHQRLEKIHGSFAVCEPSEQVRQILRLTGLEQRLVRERGALLGQSARGVTSHDQARAVALPGVDFEVYDLPRSDALVCRAVGNPDLLEFQAFTAAHCRGVPFDCSTHGLGLGAFGRGFEDCRDRFGEFLAVAGAAVQLPGRNGASPDYQLCQGSFVPEVQVLYALRLSGGFSHLARFSRPREEAPLGLSTLARHLRAMARAEWVGFVIIGDASGLVGSALRRSPVNGAAAASLFEPQTARDCLMYTPERVFPHSLVLAVGVAGGANPKAPVAGFVRPLDAAAEIVGHCHAAVFPYRPLKKRYLELPQTVASLFESESVLALLHLVGDFRDLSGAGETEFGGAACWFGEIGDFERVN